MHLRAEELRFHGLFPCQHLIHVATDGVDLTVVDNDPVRMGSHPAWIGVGTETGMYRCQSRFIILILKIRKELPKLFYQEHAFVYDDLKHLHGLVSG